MSTKLKPGGVLICLMLLRLSWTLAAFSAESQGVIVPVSADGVQRMEVTVDSYSFTPNRLIVRENIPVELTLKSVTWLVPHNFVFKSPEAGLDRKSTTSELQSQSNLVCRLLLEKKQATTHVAGAASARSAGILRHQTVTLR